MAGRKKRTAHSKAVDKALVKTEYEAGLLTQKDLCIKYGIHRGTLHRWAVAGEWEFAVKRESPGGHRRLWLGAWVSAEQRYRNSISMS